MARKFIQDTTDQLNLSSNQYIDAEGKTQSFMKVEVPFNYKRGNPAPLDKSSVWTTLSAAQSYAKDDGTAYVGQVITVNDDTGVSAYVIENTDGSLKMLATGGDAYALEAKLNKEITDRGNADSFISGVVDSISADLGTLSGEFNTLTGTTLPEKWTEINQNLSVTVEAQVSAETGYLKTYVVKQGGTQVGVKINIPNDFLIKKAEVKVCVEKDKPIEGLNVGDKYLDFTINAKEGEGGEQHIYVNLKDLTDIYTGGETSTVKVTVGSDNKISADVKTGSIGFEHITNDLSNYIKGIKDDLAQEVTDRGNDVASARTDLSGYVNQKYGEATQYTDGKIAALSTSVEAGKTADEAQKVFVKITEDNGIVNAESVQLKVKDIYGLSTAIDQSESNAKAYTDSSLDALDWSNNIASTQRVKSIVQTNGAVTVEAEDMHLSNIVNVKNELKGELDDTYDAKGSATTAETNAKAFATELCVSLSTTVDSKIKGIETEIGNARKDLSAYACETSANALVEAKSYVNTVSSHLDGKIDDETDNRKKAVSDLSTELKGDISEIKRDYALSADVTAISVDLVGKIGTAKSEAIQSAAEDATTKVTNLCVSLSTTVDTKLKTEKDDREAADLLLSSELSSYAEQKASAAQKAAELSAQAVRDDLSGYVEYTWVKGGKEALTTTNLIVTQDDIKELTGVMHFVGVTTDPQLSNGFTGKPTGLDYGKDENPKKGDFAIRSDNAKEFIFSGVFSSGGKWNEIGDESLYAKQADLEAEVERATTAEDALSTDYNAKFGTANTAITTISTDLGTLSGKYETFTTVTYANDKNALCSGISSEYDRATAAEEALESEIAAEVAARSSADENLLSTLSNDYVDKIGSAKNEVLATQISAITINGESYDVDDRVASIQISCIDCGGAN